MTDDVEETVLLSDEDGRVRTRLRVNGRAREVAVHPTETLLDALRNLQLDGVRGACGVGVCGACTVLRDGEPVDGCLTLAVLCGASEITTVEGLAGGNGELSPVQEAFLRHRAFQCSYCTPGFVLALQALLRRTPEPTEDDVREAFSGHLCRCGSYSRIVAAALDVIAAGRR